jgi:hypothetical protein
MGSPKNTDVFYYVDSKFSDRSDWEDSHKESMESSSAENMQNYFLVHRIARYDVNLDDHDDNEDLVEDNEDEEQDFYSSGEDDDT